MSKKIPIIVSVIIAAVTAIIVINFSTSREYEIENNYRAAEIAFISRFINLDNPYNNFRLSLDYSHNMGFIGSMLGIDIPQINLIMESSTVEKNNLTDLNLTLNGEPIQIQYVSQLGQPTKMFFPGLSQYFITTENNQINIFAETAIINDILNIYFDLLSDIKTFEENVFISSSNLDDIDDIYIETNLYTIGFTSHFFENFFEAFFELHPELLPIFSDNIDYIKENVNAVMKVWLKDGNIISRNILIETGTEILELVYENLQNNNQRWYNLTLSRISDFEDFEVSIRGIFTQQGQGFSGLANISFNELSFDVDVDQLRMNNNNVFLGSLRYRDTLDAVNLSLLLELGDQNGNQTLDINGEIGAFGFNIDIGDIRMIFSTDRVNDISLPSFDPDFQIMFEDNSEENLTRMMSLVEDLDSIPAIQSIFNMILNFNSNFF